MSSEIKRLQTGTRMSQVVIANGFVHHLAGQVPTRACVQALLMKPGLDVEIAVSALA